LTDGLTDAEIAAVEQRFGFTFAPDHRELVSAALPLGRHWVDWRAGSEEELTWRLRRPIDGVLFDVAHSDFWPVSWGIKPRNPTAAAELAAECMAAVPRLVPVFSHRYLPVGPCPAGMPVFSVHQTDVIYYGNDLLHYLRREFLSKPIIGGRTEPKPPRGGQPPIRYRAPFWADLAEGAENGDL
jgi:hypothetical protein